MYLAGSARSNNNKESCSPCWACLVLLLADAPAACDAPGVPQHNQSRCGHWRRHGDGVPSQGNAGQHGVCAIPPDRLLRIGRHRQAHSGTHLPHLRGPARRGRPPVQPLRPQAGLQHPQIWSIKHPASDFDNFGTCRCRPCNWLVAYFWEGSSILWFAFFGLVFSTLPDLFLTSLAYVDVMHV